MVSCDRVIFQLLTTENIGDAGWQERIKAYKLGKSCWYLLIVNLSHNRNKLTFVKQGFD